MPVLTIDQFDGLLKTGKLQSLYLFDGPELWLKERAVKKIIDKLLPGDGRDFNLEKFDGTSSSGGDVASSAQSLPFLSERRVIIVQSAEEFSSADSKIIGETLSSLPPTTCLVFLYAGKANLREEIPAMVSTYGALITCWTPFPNQLPKWVAAEARARGRTIDFQAAEALAESCSDLQQISNELDKLFLFVGKKTAITYQDVLAHGLPDDSGDQKKLEEAVLLRDLPEAMRQGKMLWDLGSRPEAIFPTFERIFRNMILARHYIENRGMRQDEVLRTLGIRGITQQANFSKAVQLYSKGEMEDGIRKIAEADYQLKTGALSGEMDLSLLILNLVGKAGVTV